MKDREEQEQKEGKGSEGKVSDKSYGGEGTGPLAPCYWRGPAPQTPDQSTFL